MRKKNKNDSVSGLDNWVMVVPLTEFKKQTGEVLGKLKLRLLSHCLEMSKRHFDGSVT